MFEGMTIRGQGDVSTISETLNKSKPDDFVACQLGDPATHLVQKKKVKRMNKSRAFTGFSVPVAIPVLRGPQGKIISNSANPRMLT
jgi:hypothetical protein